ncbi:MAG: sugar ABC transporter substrate-binding protein [Candidatus Gastranaerophilales bacterium]|nr:sugar ABC transporter substrate-binding protein [Candidatus Gastranaerophilales bacterium]
MKKILLAAIIVFLLLFAIFPKNPQKNEDKTVIKFSSWGSKTEYAIIKNLIAQYEEQNPNIKIEFIHVPEDYFRKLHLLYAARTAPDVVFLNNTYAPLYIKAGLLDDISDIIDQNEFFESALDCFKYDGKFYAVPRDVSNLVLYVNKNIVKNPEKIKTIDDLRFYAKKYTTDKIFGLNYEKNPLFWLYYLNVYNGGILSDDGKSVIIDSAESLKGLKLYVDMINQDKSVPHEWQMSSMTSAQMFINGKMAMYLSGRWLVPKFRETIAFDWDIIPFPQDNNSKVLTDASGWGLSASSKHKKEALDFIKFLSSENISKQFTATGLITPARKKVANSDLFLNKNAKPKNSKVFIDILKNSKSTPVNTNYTQITDETVKTVLPYFNGTKTLDETVLNPQFKEKLTKSCNNAN